MPNSMKMFTYFRPAIPFLGKLGPKGENIKFDSSKKGKFERHEFEYANYEGDAKAFLFYSGDIVS